LALRQRFDERFRAQQHYVVVGIIPVYFAVVLLATSTLTIVAWTLTLGAVLFVMIGAPRTVVAAALVAAVVLTIAVPILIILKTGGDEVPFFGF
jgi:hypothetical protein